MTDRRSPLVALVVAPLIALSFSSDGRELPDASVIVIDQLGYRPSDRKVAIVADDHGLTYEIRNAATGKAVAKGSIPRIGKRDETTNDFVFYIDFTSLREPGTYEIAVPELQARSAPFRIDDDVYRPAFQSALESFYYQRCGTEVKNGTRWTHPPCHVHDARVFGETSAERDVTGGWHDAGDYGKFMVTAAVSTAFLLTLYEMQPAKFGDGGNIPESHNGIPDILDEARWELSWMLKMQQEKGDLCHKVSTMKWTGEYLPQEDPDTRYLFPSSSAATAAFAAVAAQGARLWTSWDPAFAGALLHAAVKAWTYLNDHPRIVPAGGFRNPPGVEGGEYGDVQDDDERLWAAAELYRTTSDPAYLHAFSYSFQNLNGVVLPVGWEHVQNLGYYEYLTLPPSATDAQLRSTIFGNMTAYWNALLPKIDGNGYNCVLAPDEYYWGSNSVVAGYAFDLVCAFELTHERRYLDGALDQLHYLLGRNGCRISFVTGVGSRPAQNPYHQFSMMLSAGAPVPGMVVGGPNREGRLRGKVLSDFPAKCYEDNAKNYYVNEVAINYTAPFTFLAGYFMQGSPPGDPHHQSGRSE